MFTSTIMVKLEDSLYSLGAYNLTQLTLKITKDQNQPFPLKVVGFLHAVTHPK